MAAGLRGRAVFSEAPGHLGELAVTAARDGAQLLVVVGGDGSVNEVADGLLKAALGGAVELAVLPNGTGRDFVRSMRIPREFGEAIEVARNGRTRTIDAGRASFTRGDGTTAERYFANFAGAGISGAIARKAESSSKALGGRISFMRATISVFVHWHSEEIAVKLDADARSGRMFEVLAMNGDYTAGGMWMSPAAVSDDGLLDVVLIGDVTKLDFILTFPKIYRGRHLSHPKIEVVKSRSVSIQPTVPLPIVLDGEQPGTTPATFEIVPGALRLRVPG